MLALLALLQLAAAAAVPNMHPRRHAERAAATTDKPVLAQLSYNPKIKDAAFIALSRDVPNILANAIEITTHSWELGTLTEALLEVYNPSLTPFNYLPSALEHKSIIPTDVVRITAKELSGYSWSGSPSPGADADLSNYLSSSNSKSNLNPQALVDGAGSLGDPASLGTATWVTAHFADLVKGVDNLASDDAYAWAVGNQLAYLQAGAKADNGTISQREGHVELWSDMGYMIPPFLAYLGLTTNNTELLAESFNQWNLISSGLLDQSTNLYRHVNSFDPRFWATGNGWMLCGLVRVIASLRAAKSTIDTKAAEQTAANVFKALFERLDASSRLPNYMDQQDTSLSHSDSSGTAAVVAAYYRFLVLNPTLAAPFKPAADKAFAAVVGKVNKNYWLTEVVDPMGTNGFLVFPEKDTKSPEGQSLLALMWAARHAAGQ